MGASSPILDRTTNFIDLYMHHCGRAEVPSLYHLWCCLTLLAACVADRVWIEKFKGAKLAPSLYTMLIGPSGTGKGVAIDAATKFVRHIPRVNLYRGRATAPHIVDRLGKPFRRADGTRVIANPKLFLVTPELASSVRSGDVAVDFIMLMTDLFTGSPDPITEGTRMRGEVVIESPCINWLAGTTREWLVRSVPRDAIEGGFFGRVVVASASYTGEPFVRPIYPTDYADVVAHLMARVEALSHFAGPFTLTAEASEREGSWYNARKEPRDDMLKPAFHRQHDLMLKLAMLLSLADGLDGVIRERHVEDAQKLAESVLRAVPAVQVAASTVATPESWGIHFVRETVKREKRMTHTLLLRYFANRGGNADQLRTAVQTLIEAREVARVPGPHGGWVYLWMRGRRLDA